MCDLVMPGLAEFIFTNYSCDAGSYVYIVRCYTRMNQLYESGRSVDLSSHTCLCKWLILVFLREFERARLYANVEVCANMFVNLHSSE